MTEQEYKDKIKELKSWLGQYAIAYYSDGIGYSYTCKICKSESYTGLGDLLHKQHCPLRD